LNYTRRKPKAISGWLIAFGNIKTNKLKLSAKTLAYSQTLKAISLF